MSLVFAQYVDRGWRSIVLVMSKQLDVWILHHESTRERQRADAHTTKDDAEMLRRLPDRSFGHLKYITLLRSFAKTSVENTGPLGSSLSNSSLNRKVVNYWTTIASFNRRILEQPSS
jgi:hypothetical protein